MCRRYVELDEFFKQSKSVCIYYCVHYMYFVGHSCLQVVYFERFIHVQFDGIMESMKNQHQHQHPSTRNRQANWEIMFVFIMYAMMTSENRKRPLAEMGDRERV